MRRRTLLILWSIFFLGIVSSYNNCGKRNAPMPVINMHTVSAVDFYSCDYRSASGSGIVGSFCSEQQLGLGVSEASLNQNCATSNPPGIFSGSFCSINNSVGTCVYGSGSNGETHRVFYSDGGTPWTTASALSYCENTNGAFVP